MGGHDEWQGGCARVCVGGGAGWFSVWNTPPPPLALSANQNGTDTFTQAHSHTDIHTQHTQDALAPQLIADPPTRAHTHTHTRTHAHTRIHTQDALAPLLSADPPTKAQDVEAAALAKKSAGDMSDM